MAASNEEREMTIHQRGLVDTCFEEGQYESGIAVLDQLRSPSFKPPVDHVRQLLYIALFPPTTDQINQHEFPPSPIKGSLAKLNFTLPFFPSAADSDAAHRVLFSFLATNSPSSLFRALPRYPLEDLPDGELPTASSDNSHDEDSPIARESLCIKDSRDCWTILKDGFIQRKKLLSQDTRKKRARRTYDVEDADPDQGQAHDPPVVVAEHAWRVLHWLLSLFEKDELLKFHKSGARFSLLLLSQIPPPRGGTGLRWDAGVPLDIVFHAVDQNDAERRDMATQLLALLIHLSLSGSFDGPMLATTLATRLYTCSPRTIQNLMEGLPKTIPMLSFKITVCQKFLSSSSSITGGTKPRPRPLPRRGARRDSEVASSTADADIGRTGSTVASRPVLLTCSDVFQLLCSEHQSQKSAPEPLVSTIKYVLLVSYARLQGLLSPEERDRDWKDAPSSGRLKQIIDTTFPRDSTYHKALTIITRFWPAA